MEDKIKRKRGRPRKEGSFDKVTRFRTNDEYEYMKRALEEKMNKTGGEVMREALELLYNMQIGWKN